MTYNVSWVFVILLSTKNDTSFILFSVQHRNNRESHHIYIRSKPCETFKLTSHVSTSHPMTIGIRAPRNV